jgi:hypothetical protein
MAESLRFLGSMEGHKGWVTAIATSSENPDMILTASRGIWSGVPSAFALIRAYRMQTKRLLYGN